MKILLLRHAKTLGNLEHRYVGNTDEDILTEYLDVLETLGQKKEKIGKLVSSSQNIFLCGSPLKRCKQTADILFPGIEYSVVEQFRECNFGLFEYKNYEELNGNEDYQRYIDSGGEIAFPGGESKAEFISRTQSGFEMLLDNIRTSDKENILILVVHGGTIMALLDQYSNPHKDYFNWQVKNGEGFIADLNISYYDKINNQNIMNNDNKMKEIKFVNIEKL